MPLYIVTVTVTELYSVEVEADSIDEAEEKAEDVELSISPFDTQIEYFATELKETQSE